MTHWSPFSAARAPVAQRGWSPVRQRPSAHIHYLFGQSQNLAAETRPLAQQFMAAHAYPDGVSQSLFDELLTSVASQWMFDFGQRPENKGMNAWAYRNVFLEGVYTFLMRLLTENQSITPANRQTAVSRMIYVDWSKVPFWDVDWEWMRVVGKGISNDQWNKFAQKMGSADAKQFAPQGAFADDLFLGKGHDTTAVAAWQVGASVTFDLGPDADFAFVVLTNPNAPILDGYYKPRPDGMTWNQVPFADLIWATIPFNRVPWSKKITRASDGSMVSIDEFFRRILVPDGCGKNQYFDAQAMECKLAFLPIGPLTTPTTFFNFPFGVIIPSTPVEPTKPGGGTGGIIVPGAGSPIFTPGVFGGIGGIGGGGQGDGSGQQEGEAPECQSPNMIDPISGACLSPEQIQAAALQKACTDLGGLFDPTTGQCTPPVTASPDCVPPNGLNSQGECVSPEQLQEEMKAEACAALGGMWDAVKKTCGAPGGATPCNPPNVTDPATGACLTPQQILERGMACTMKGGTFNTATLACDGEGTAGGGGEEEAPEEKKGPSTGAIVAGLAAVGVAVALVVAAVNAKPSPEEEERRRREEEERRQREMAAG